MDRKILQDQATKQQNKAFKPSMEPGQNKAFSFTQSEHVGVAR